MAWILVPCLGSLRAELDQLAPKRDKSSSGSIGDGEHSQNSSDHNPDETGKTPTEDADSRNEVHAIDEDKDGPWPAGWSMERCVQTIVLRHRSGKDDRLQNVIYNRRIWSRTWGWTARAYTGPNPHDHHAHFSARYTTAQENDTRPWGLLEAAQPAQTIAEEFVMATREDVKQALLEVLGQAHPLPGAIGTRLHKPKPEGPGWGNMSDRELVARLFEMSLTNTRAVAALSQAFAAFVEAEELDDGAVRAALDAQEKALAEMRAVLDDAVEDDSAGAHAQS